MASGSWKVAYADFTTAMMAFFMVLWLVNADPKVKEAVAKYFNEGTSQARYHPVSSRSSGLLPNEIIQQAKGEGNFTSADATELLLLRKMNQDLIRALEEDPALAANKDLFKLKFTPDGVRLTVFNQSTQPIFKADTTEFTEQGDWILGNLAFTIDQYRQFDLEIEGHTHQSAAGAPDGSDTWALSAQRAIVTRKKLIDEGIVARKVVKIGGFGDSKPLDDQEPTNELNNRVDLWFRSKP
ncbi:MAG: flagellar motor protein MotB [Verrucomicrobiota bacterium]|nr:flagellar motor protein MotB [Verrucomicrobiota bacterium]MDG1891493.1 flagellar motor protein MotB [Verrucomicrobiota bacterium]